MISRLSNMSIDEFIKSWGDELSYLSTPNYTQALTREDIINARNILYGANPHLTAATAIDALNMSARQEMVRSRQPVHYDTPTFDEIIDSYKEEINMSKRMPTRAKIIKLIGYNETEDADYVKYIGQTFKVVEESSTYRGKKGYRLCLRVNHSSLDSVRFDIDELELYYDDDEIKGEY